MDETWKCPQCGAWCAAFEKSCSECWGKSLDATESKADTVSERPGYFRGAKISKPVNRGQKS
jgi:hypothetical protein